MAAAESNGGVVVKTPVHLWIVGVLSLLWNSMGAFDYLASQLKLEFYMGQFEPELLEYFYNIPPWAIGCWAIGVWFAFAGSVGLLLRKRWSMWAFGISIAGMILNSVYSYILSNGLEIMGTGGLIFSAVIWVVAFALFFYARAMCAKGVLT